ncbi:MAG: hypothetical protein NVSMB7_04250 [Chitinophagaceae bacterium]
MGTGKKKHFRIIVLLLLFTAMVLFLSRYDILFAFQYMRLRQLGCNEMGNSIPVKTGMPVNGCEKFWVHRADSYERFVRLSPYFPGLEADLVFDKQVKKFRVYHPPARPGNLFADSYFQFIKTSGKKLWLDIKNIDSTEFNDAIRLFLESDSIYGLKKNVIIESSQINFVNRLAKLGFTVSYMASYRDLERNDRYETESAAKLFPEVKFVSQEDIYVDRLKATFPGKKIITWAIAFKNYFDLSHYRVLLTDTSIQVVLINIKSRDYR